MFFLKTLIAVEPGASVDMKSMLVEVDTRRSRKGMKSGSCDHREVGLSLALRAFSARSLRSVAMTGDAPIFVSLGIVIAPRTFRVV